MSDRVGYFDAGRVIVMAAPNGARRTREDHPALPTTTAELAAEAEALADAGVSVLHLHVRDDDGRHTLDPARYRAALEAIHERLGDALVIQVTTEAVGLYSAEEQMNVVRELRPEAVSIALRELCPTTDDEPVAARFFAWLRQEGIWPQYILYSQDDVRRFDDMRRRGVFAESAPFVMLVAGRYAGGQFGTVAELDALLASVDSEAFPWACCCFGPSELDVMLAAVEAGGHVRLGFENNLLLADGTPAPDNAALIAEFVAAIDGGPRRPASTAAVREYFGGRGANLL